VSEHDSFNPRPPSKGDWPEEVSSGLPPQAAATTNAAPMPRKKVRETLN
jgi:hypothetical protein